MLGHEERGTAAAKRMAKARTILGTRDENAPAIEAHTRDLLDARSWPCSAARASDLPIAGELGANGRWALAPAR